MPLFIFSCLHLTDHIISCHRDICPFPPCKARISQEHFLVELRHSAGRTQLEKVSFACSNLHMLRTAIDTNPRSASQGILLTPNAPKNISLVSQKVCQHLACHTCSFMGQQRTWANTKRTTSLSGLSKLHPDWDTTREATEKKFPQNQDPGSTWAADPCLRSILRSRRPVAGNTPKVYPSSWFADKGPIFGHTHMNNAYWDYLATHGPNSGSGLLPPIWSNGVSQSVDLVCPCVCVF